MTVNSNLSQRKGRQRGIVTLVVATGILMTAGIMGLYVSKSSVLEQKQYNNSYQSKQAFEAAEAGLEYGANYLNTNWKTLTKVSSSSGAIDGANTPVSLGQSNSSKSVVSFTNPDKNTTEYIKISATGKSSDNSSDRTVSQLFKFMPLLQSNKFPQVPITVKKDIVMSGAVKIYGVSSHSCGSSSTAIWSGGNVDVNGAVKINNNKIKSPSARQSIVSGDVNLANATEESLFRNYFGTDTTHFKENFADQIKYYSAQPDLDGVKGQVIWVNGDLDVSSQSKIGTATEPVVLIVQGDLKITGGVEVKGFVYVMGDYIVGAGNSSIEGGLVVTGIANIAGTQDLYYDTDILTTLRGNDGLYVRIPGSWIDA